MALRRMRKIAMDNLTHRDICTLAAEWLLEGGKHWLAGVELQGGGGSHGVMDAVGVTDPHPGTTHIGGYRQYLQGLMAWTEEFKAWQKTANRTEAFVKKPPRYPHGTGGKARPLRVSVVECKRTRSDLLSDLRVLKMLKYEGVASHCYLCCHPDAFCKVEGRITLSANKKMILEDLSQKGLPKHWGVLVCGDRSGEVYSFRNAKKIQERDEVNVRVMADHIARSWMFRSMKTGLGGLPL